MRETITRWATVIRDVGIILGIPTLIIVGMKMYGLQIDTLTQQNALLKETQYDRALSLIKSQKELFDTERQALTTRITFLTESGESASTEVKNLEQQLERVNQRIASFNDIEINYSQSRFRDNVVFKHSMFDANLDFEQTYLSGNVNFVNSRFKGRVNFSGSIFEGGAEFRQSIFSSPLDFSDASLRGAVFKNTDLRGVDLSDAIIDQTTRLPVFQN